VRESPAISIIRSLISDGCRIQAYDPAAVGNARELLGTENIDYVTSAMEAASNADALRYPIVIDGRNMFSVAAMAEHGFIYSSVGRADPESVSSLRPKQVQGVP